jgi:hypothetical protein
MAAVTPARYFIAAAIVLLLGAPAMPVGIAAYSIAGSSDEPYATAMGVWAVFVVIIAVTGPIVLTLAGIIALGTRHDARSEDRPDPMIEDAVAWLSEEPQISGRR